MQATIGLDGEIDQPLYGFGIGNVDSKGTSLASLRADLVGDATCSIGVKIGNDNLTPSLPS